MRVTSDLWVSAVLRRLFAAGAFGAVVRRGASEAGAIFVTVRGRAGLTDLYGPALQASYADARPDERQFQRLMAQADESEIETYFAKEARFDPDFWVLEAECDETLLNSLLTIRDE